MPLLFLMSTSFPLSFYIGKLSNQSIPVIAGIAGLTGAAASLYFESTQPKKEFSEKEKLHFLLHDQLGDLLLSLHNLDVCHHKWKGLIHKIYTRCLFLKKMYRAGKRGTYTAILFAIPSAFFSQKSATAILAWLLQDKTLKNEISQNFDQDQATSSDPQTIVLEYSARQDFVPDPEYPYLAVHNYLITLRQKLYTFLNIQRNVSSAKTECEQTENALNAINTKIDILEKSPHFLDEKRCLTTIQKNNAAFYAHITPLNYLAK